MNTSSRRGRSETPSSLAAGHSVEVQPGAGRQPYLPPTEGRAAERQPRRAWLAALAAFFAIQVASGPIRAQAPEAPSGAQDEAKPQTGTLRVLVFYLNAPLKKALVKAGGQRQETNEDGTVQLEVAPGQIEVSVRFRAADTNNPLGRLARGTQTLGVVAGETTEVMIALDSPSGDLSWDIEGPSEAQVEQAVAAEAQTEFGTLVGHVTSIEDSSPVKSARVFVRGVDAESVTDATGRFEMRVPVGLQAISIIHPRFSTLSRPDIEVKVDETTEIDVVLTPASVRMDDFIVTAPHIEGSVAGLMNERRESSAVSDAVGREDIAKMPANDAAQAAQRVVGATIVGGRFVYVRGLGERYTNTLLNGSPLPSPEPDRAAVPLDLFPTQILDSLDIVKTFTPDYPGDFAGGSVRIKTRGVPEEFTLQVQLAGTYNSQSSFQPVYSHQGHSLDWLGFDNGSRAMPSEVPQDYPLDGAKPDGTYPTDQELLALGPAINSPMTVYRDRFPLGGRASLLVGNGWDFKRGRRFGVLGSAMYRNGFDVRKETRRIYEYSPDKAYKDVGGLKPFTDYDAQYADDWVRWGAFGTAVFEASEKHKINLVAMYNQLSDKETVVSSGYQAYENTAYETTRLQYTTKGLFSGQLQGEHTFDEANGAFLDWRVFLSQASRNQPDTRDVVFKLNNASENYEFAINSLSGRHFWSSQNEFARGGALDWTQPLTDGWFTSKLKFGTMLNAKKRSFNARRLNFEKYTRDGAMLTDCGSSYDPIECPGNFYGSDGNVGSSLIVHEGYRDGDTYDAVLNVYAGYLMADANLGEHWRLLGGARLEKTQQDLRAYSPFTGEDVDNGVANLSSLNILPAGSVVFSATDDFHIRAAASKTLARPQLRELAPFSFANYFGGRPESGYPGLTLTDIVNVDLRLEWFPNPSEVIAVTGFVKKFTNPIEPTLIPSSENYVTSYRNALGAWLYGVEFEARASLGFMTEVLEEFTFISSLMVAQSEIKVEQTGKGTLTNLDRPMVNQSPYVVNLALDYDHPSSATQLRLLYNVSGRQLVTVGVDGLPDAYLHPRNMLDATYTQGIGEHFSLKLSATNLLNAPYLVTQGKKKKDYNVVTEYTQGTSVSLSLTFMH